MLDTGDEESTIFSVPKFEVRLLEVRSHSDLPPHSVRRVRRNYYCYYYYYYYCYYYYY